MRLKFKNLHLTPSENRGETSKAQKKNATTTTTTTPLAAAAAAAARVTTTHQPAARAPRANGMPLQVSVVNYALSIHYKKKIVPIYGEM